MKRRRYHMAKEAGLSLMAFSLLLSPCSVSLAGATAGQQDAETAKSNPFISFHDEKLTLRAQDVPLVQLLESVAKTCSLRIFSATKLETNTIVSVEMIDWEVEEALTDLLQGCNHLIVYNEDSETSGLFSTGGGAREALVASRHHETYSANNVTYDQADYFRGQIDMLSQRIESGASDRWYENTISWKDPQFVTHDSELLASYEDRLARIEGGN